MIPIFIADVHLGKLARWLRMAGFDVLYSPSFTPEEMVDLAKPEKRIILTKTTSFSKQYQDTDIYLITSSDPLQQCRQVIYHYDLKDKFQPFTRCIVCNHALEKVSKEKILDLLPQQTSLYYHEFWQCTNCRRVYWKGPHYKRMLTRLSQLLDD